MQEYYCLNGKLMQAEKVHISPNNRSFRYGDGFFETIKVRDGKICLQQYHMERLFASLKLLKFDIPKWLNEDYISNHILETVIKNNHSKLARVRLTIFRGDGGLYDTENNFPNHLIQSWPLNNTVLQLNENGLVTGIFRNAIKSCDSYSHVKSNNYLSYAMAAIWAKANHFNDAIILNHKGCIADATIANAFIIKDGAVLTPALTEGCVAGVMRRHLIQQLKIKNIPVQETSINEPDLKNATEVFFTNAIYGLKWVQSVDENIYSRNKCMEFFGFASRMF